MCVNCNKPSVDSLMKVDADGTVWISAAGIEVYKQAVALQGVLSMDVEIIRVAESTVKVLDVLAKLLPDMYVDLTDAL